MESCDNRGAFPSAGGRAESPGVTERHRPHPGRTSACKTQSKRMNGNMWIGEKKKETSLIFHTGLWLGD